MVQITVGRWGTNLAVRIPADIAQAIKLRKGERVEIEVHASEVVIRRARPHVSLENLFGGRSPDDWRADYTGAYTWAPDISREIVPE